VGVGKGKTEKREGREREERKKREKRKKKTGVCGGERERIK